MHVMLMNNEDIDGVDYDGDGRMAAWNNQNIDEEDPGLILMRMMTDISLGFLATAS